jgi:hypothetical protein
MAHIRWQTGAHDRTRPATQTEPSQVAACRWLRSNGTGHIASAPEAFGGALPLGWGTLLLRPARSSAPGVLPQKLRHCQRVSGIERAAASKLRHLVINLDREVLGGGCGLGRVAAWRGQGR